MSETRTALVVELGLLVQRIIDERLPVGTQMTSSSVRVLALEEMVRLDIEHLRIDLPR